MHMYKAPPVLSVREYMPTYKDTASIGAAESAGAQCTIYNHRPLVYWTGTVVSGVTCTRYLHGAVRARLWPVEHGVLPPAAHPSPTTVHLTASTIHCTLLSLTWGMPGQGEESGVGRGRVRVEIGKGEEGKGRGGRGRRRGRGGVGEVGAATCMLPVACGHGREAT